MIRQKKTLIWNTERKINVDSEYERKIHKFGIQARKYTKIRNIYRKIHKFGIYIYRKILKFGIRTERIPSKIRI